MLFYHWRKEDIELIGKFDTYEGTLQCTRRSDTTSAIEI